MLRRSAHLGQDGEGLVDRIPQLRRQDAQPVGEGHRVRLAAHDEHRAVRQNDARVEGAREVHWRFCRPHLRLGKRAQGHNLCENGLMRCATQPETAY